jgi:DNA end-binding protein Ku
VLTMATMRFADEVTKPEDLGEDFVTDKPKTPEKRELDMAKQLIESLTSEFDVDKYRDEYREELLAMLERKAEGKEIVSAESEEPKPTKAPDLMAALEESLAAVRGESDGAAKSSSGNGGSSGNGSKSKSSSSGKSTKKKAAKKRAAKKKAKAGK